MRYAMRVGTRRAPPLREVEALRSRTPRKDGVCCSPGPNRLMLRSQARSRDALLELIDLAYQAAEDPSCWEAFLGRLADAVGGRGAVLLFHDLKSSALVGVGARNPPEAARLYAEHFCQIDPRALSPKAPALAAPLQPVSDEMLVSYNEVCRSEYHNDFSIKFEMSRILTVALNRPGGAFSGITVTRAHKDQPFGPGELRFIRMAAPHAARALRLNHLAATGRHERLAALEALERMHIAVFLAAADGSVIHANGAGSRLLASRDGLSEDDTLMRASTSILTEHLRKLCRECVATSSGSGLGSGGSLRLPRPSGRPALQVLVSPIRAESMRSLIGTTACLVFVADPSTDAPPDRLLLAAFYGYTAAEAHVASRLAMGQTAKEIAAELHYTEQTTAWYCKQVIAKAGCRSRAAFIREVARTLPSLQRVAP
jgi:DNA-binding CsgD family transcriptional regulator/GAF domain-containing protein